MGTIGARDCMRVLELTEQVAAALLLSVCQGVEIRQREGAITDANLTAAMKSMKQEVFEKFEFLEEDRPLDKALKQFVSLIQQQEWELY